MLFEPNPPHLIEETMFHVNCFDNNMTLNPSLKLNYTMMKKGKIKNPCEPGLIKKTSLVDLIGTINNTDHQYSFNAKCIDSQIFINLGSLNFSSTSNEIRTIYIIFNKQPVICRFIFNQSELVRNKTCMKNATLTVAKFCYYDPLLDTLSHAVDWNLLEIFFANPSYAPSDWQTKNGYYYNDKLLTTITTISTTTISSLKPTSLPASIEDITSFSIDETTTFSTVSTTVLTTTVTETDRIEDTTSFSSSDITTLSTISTAPSITTFIEFDTTLLSTTSNNPTLATSIISDIFTSSIESSTPSITTSIESNEIISSIITTTDADHILNTTFETISTTLLDTSTTSPKSSKSSKGSKTSKISASTTSMIPLNRLPSTEKSSSRNKYIILLIFIIGIIALMSFLVYFYQHYGNNHSQSLLSHNDSDESYDSMMTQSELDPSNEYDKETTSTHATSELSIPVPQQQQQSNTSRKQNSGRIFSTFDPDAP
ncbi:unnamed protein product [Rotaria sp. Silwood2]|nr:unnamed protein product [Rotaria sp. Silwood2]CAF3919239.1 unnamed protein product [Rotaria sp. Silwood2]